MRKFQIGDRVIYKEDSFNEDIGTIINITEEFNKNIYWVKWDSDSAVQWTDAKNLTLERTNSMNEQDIYNITKEDAETLLTALQKQDTVLYLLLKKSLFN